MLQFNMTYHARTDRLDRLVLCVEKFGIGEFVAQQHDEKRRSVRKLTSTGLVLVINEHNKLVTGYMATVAQAKAIYQSEYNASAPRWLITVACKNYQRFQELI